MIIEGITPEEQDIYDLHVKINRLHATIGRMFEKGLITCDMIAEALDDENLDNATYEDLKVIYNSWGGDPHYNAKALKQFALILKVIRSYQ